MEVYQPWSNQSLVEVAAHCLKSSPHTSEPPPKLIYTHFNFATFQTAQRHTVSICLLFLSSGERRVRGQPACGYGRNPSIFVSVCLCPATSSAFQSSDLYGVHCPLLLPLQRSAQATAEPSQQVVVFKTVDGSNVFLYFSLCLQYLMVCCAYTNS